MIRVNGSPAPTMNPCEAKKKNRKKKKDALSQVTSWFFLRTSTFEDYYNGIGVVELQHQTQLLLHKKGSW